MSVEINPWDLDNVYPFENMTDIELKDNLVACDVGWSSTQLLESLFIEAIIGLSGFNCSEHYKSWAEDRTGLNLSEWYADEVTIFENWLPSLREQFPEFHDTSLPEDNCSYQVWSCFPDEDAIKTSKRKVFCLKHSSYKFIPSMGLGYALDCREKSYELLQKMACQSHLLVNHN